MRKVYAGSLLTIWVVLLCSLNAYAQNPGFGLRGGINLANFGGDDADGADMKVGFAVGGFLNHAVNEKFSIQPEILFTTKGAKTDLLFVEFDFKLNYIEIPVLGVLTFPGDIDFVPQIVFGPAISFNVSSDVDFGDESEENEDTAVIDFGLIVGGGFTYQKFVFDVRYNFGLVSVDDSSDNTDLKNRTVTFMFGVKF